VAAEIRAAGGKVMVMRCDLLDAAQCEAAAQEAKSAFGGRIDILVNVAGGSGPVGKSGVETTPAEFDDIVSLNMSGCFHTMRAVLPAMIAQRYGKIVNVGGTFGMGQAGRMASASSGAARDHRGFALEVGVRTTSTSTAWRGRGRWPALR
jgi:3-oxoacyl-[acyl-carrier protein] reductase